MDQTIDLGLRQKVQADRPSMDDAHVVKFEEFLSQITPACNPADFIVRRNKFPARGNGTITTFASSQLHLATRRPVQAMQIEMKPQLRVARRFSRASLHACCGPYQAHSTSVLHMLQSLVNFIEYLTFSA